MGASLFSRSLPSEIVDIIIDHLHDYRALCACSMTCSALLPASHYHLFSEVVMTDLSLVRF